MTRGTTPEWLQVGHVAVAGTPGVIVGSDVAWVHLPFPRSHLARPCIGRVQRAHLGINETAARHSGPCASGKPSGPAPSGAGPLYVRRDGWVVLIPEG